MAALNLGVLHQEMNYTPFSDKPAKAAYMSRDVERRAGKYGIPVQVPVPYPAKNPRLANRIAIVGMQEGWGEQFIQAAYRSWFQLGQETGSDPDLTESLREVGQDPRRVLREPSPTRQPRSSGRRQTRHANSASSAAQTLWLAANCSEDDCLETAVSSLRYGRVV
jgi:2-hydroxychromene-2-carboxylate isomerase